MGFGHEVADRELELMGVPEGVACGHQPMSGSEKGTDVGCLGDPKRAGAQERHGKGWWLVGVGGQDALDRRDATAVGRRRSGHIDISGAGLLEHEAHKLAAARNRRPVEQFVRHLCLVSKSVPLDAQVLCTVARLTTKNTRAPC